VSTKYTAWFLRYESVKSWWQLDFPGCERPLFTERVATGVN